MTPLRFWLTFVAVLASLPLAIPTALAQTEDTESGAETEDARFEPAGLAAAAGRYRASLVVKRPAQPSPAAADAALKAAAQALAAKRVEAALPQLEVAVTLGREAPSVFLQLSDAWLSLPRPDADRALQAAWLAYRAAGETADRQRALERMAELLETRLDQPREALAALRALRAEGSTAPGLGERLEALRQRVGVEWVRVRVEADGEEPRVCLVLSSPLKQARGTRWDEYVRVEPATPVTVDAAGRELCIGGLAHAHRYRVALREGLASADGLVLRRTETREVAIGDRPPLAAFRGNAFILPRVGPDGVPLVTVNTDAVTLRVHRINDRNLVARMGEGALGSLESYEAEEIAEVQGERVWEGRMAVRLERNVSVVTAVPVRQLIPKPKAGLYVLTAMPADLPESEIQSTPATQWLVVTDLGLSTLRGPDGVDVFVRSLASAKPVAGANVALLARNNAELGRATTDADGRVHFPPSGAGGGNEPLLVVAYGAEGDFAVLNLGRPALDLSDRGVGGRRAPGPLDAYLYSDRGVYRPGERVNLTVLLRDDRGDAVEGFPLTLRVLRPNGTVFRSGVVQSSAAGAHVLPFYLTATAPLGTWTVQALADPKSDPVGTLRVQVEEFVPERLAVEVEGSSPAIDPARPFDLLVRARFLYGPPAAGLSGAGEVSVAPDPEPFPAFKGFRFGLVQESPTPRTESLSLPATDASGATRAEVKLPALPDTTRPLRALFRVEVSEPGGRPSRQTLTVPLRTQPFAIGIRPQFTGDRVEEGHPAAFEVVAVGPDGKRISRPGLRTELFRERVRFLWYQDEGRYTYRTSVQAESLRRGSLDLTADRFGTPSFGPLEYGRYRLEVSDESTGVASSVRFSVGWQVALDAGETPDRVEVTLDRAAYAPGDRARVRIVPPFAGELQLTVATDRVREVQQHSVPAGGATFEVPIGADWGAGAYVLATVIRSPVADREHVPVRAIGVAWLGLDPAPRTLAVRLDVPAVARPGERVEVPVRVTGPDGQPATGAWVTLAAVDEGILRLTGFTSPDPVAHYLGKRLLGLDVLDDYGRLISAISGPVGALRQGGDQGGLGASLPVVPLTIVSLFRGPVPVGADGVARIPLEVPEFDGELRLMAVAYDARRVGGTALALPVRGPLVAQLTLPRFLAPGDESRATLSLHNVEAPAGVYRLSVTAAGAVTVGDVPAQVELARDARVSVPAILRGAAAGTGSLGLALEGPGGVRLQRQLSITVRPSRAVETTFTQRRLPPGAATEAGAADLAGYVPGTGSVRLTYASRAPFDVAGILAALERYPYGCLEQVVSRALPLVGTAGLQSAGALVTAETRDARVDAAVGQVLDKQRYDGAFGAWSAYGEESAWLTAYATEFLARVRAAGRPVAEGPYRAALDWLRRHAVDGGTEKEELVSRAYAVHVLALAGVATPGPARYLHDALLAKLPTPLARAQLAAALARLGDRERAGAAAVAATENLVRDDWSVDYGSVVRDAAAMLTVLAEVDLLGDALPRLLDRLPASALDAGRLSTQEQAWVVRAASALMAGGHPVSLKAEGVALPSGDPVLIAPSAAQVAAGVKVTNVGPGEIWEAVTRTGVPVESRPAGREGMAVRRHFFTREGQPLDLDRVRQNDVFVVEVEGEATTGLHHRALLTHGLPAGWEIENVRLSGDSGPVLPWLREMSMPAALEGRDDRYVAAFDLTPDQQSFRVAYLVRAVTPGSYELPGAHLEDMYRPRFFARQAVHRVTVGPAE